MRNKMHMTRRAFVAASAIVLAGCSRATDDAPNSDEQTNQDAVALVGHTDEDDGSEATATDGGKILVAFYSRADENYANGDKEWLEVGHTKIMAEYIAEALGADIYEIVPAEPYPTGYDDCCDMAFEEQQANARPVISDEVADVSTYDTVFIGCPIWWGEEPMIIRTFVEGVDLSGKTVVPFTTHGGSGLGNVPSNLQAAIPEARFLDGHAVVGTAIDSARDEVIAWAQDLLTNL